MGGRGFPLPAAGPVDRRWRKSAEGSAGVAQRHRADQRAHPLGVAGPHLPQGQRHHHRQGQTDTGLHLRKPAGVVGLEVEAVVYRMGRVRWPRKIGQVFKVYSPD